MSQSFNIFNIRNMTHQPNNLKIQAFVYICNEIKKIIKSRASQGFYEVNYQIPAFILGYPPYNIVDCASYQYNEFIREHFEVNIRKSGDFLYLNISWKKPPPVPEPVNHLYARKYKNSSRSDAGSASTSASASASTSTSTSIVTSITMNSSSFIHNEQLQVLQK